jgi:alkanesulfonate monooxygenase SsuD/methylene tetrahydromethanopterin reductase-like flavin-dependent oxidoreductase (luciferase family)
MESLPVKFGINQGSHWTGDLTQKQVLERTIDRIVLAETLGFWSAWLTEHHFANDPDYAPYGWPGRFRAYDLVTDPIALNIWAAARTSRIRLGTGVLVLHYDNPIRVAERAAMLDVLSGGRVELGLGRGGGFMEPSVFGVPTDKAASYRKFIEEVDILLKAWSGERFSYDGEFFQFHEIEVIPTPLQRPNIPLYLGITDQPSLEFAARNGLSYAGITGAWGWGTLEKSLNVERIFVDAAAAVGRDATQAYHPTTLFLFCAETDAEAEEVAEQHLMNFSLHVESHYQRNRNGQAGLANFRPDLFDRDNLETGLEDIRKLARSQFETNLIGSPRTICEKLTALRERAPMVNYVLAIADGGDPPSEFVDQSMTRFARGVIPHFADQQQLAMMA